MNERELISENGARKLARFLKSKEGERLAHSLATAVTTTLIVQEEIDIRGKTEKQIRDEAIEAIKRLLDKNVEFKVVLDYTGTLLSEARRNKRNGRYEFALLFYATFFEHSLNGIINKAATRGKLPNKIFQNMIRESSLRSKASWLLELLGLKSFPARHRNTINTVYEKRNAFVHYKWKEIEEREHKEYANLCNNAERVIKYIQYFENKHFFHGKKHKIHGVMKIGK